MPTQKSMPTASSKHEILLAVVECNTELLCSMKEKRLSLGSQATCDVLSASSDNERALLRQAYDTLSQDDKDTGNIAALLLAYGKACAKNSRKTKVVRYKAIDIHELMQLQGKINDDFDAKAQNYSLSMMLVNGNVTSDLGMSLQVFKAWLKEDDNERELIEFNTKYMRTYLSSVKQSNAFLSACERADFDLDEYLADKNYPKELHTTRVDADSKTTLYDLMMRTVNAAMKRTRETITSASIKSPVFKRVVRDSDNSLAIQEYTL